MISKSGLSILALFYLCSMITLMNSCKSKNIDLDNYKKSKVHFGGGGGFTGKSFEFCLLENGALYNVDSTTKEYSQPIFLKKKEVKTIMNKVMEVNALNYAYNEPGNMYKYIKTTKSDEEDLKLVWGNPELMVDDKVNELYKELIELTKAFNPKND